MNGFLNEKMNSAINEINASSVDPNSSSNSTNQLLQQHKDAVENIMNNNTDKMGSNLIEEQLNNLHINPQDVRNS